MEIYTEIRDRVFAYGAPGKKAKAVVQYLNGKYRGVRGRKPTIPEDAKRATGLSDAIKQCFNRLLGRDSN